MDRTTESGTVQLRTLLSPRMLLVVYGLAVAVTIVVAVSTTTAAFGAYNTQWDGTGELRELGASSGLDVTVVTAVDQYPVGEANGTVAFVLSPEEAYTPAETERLAAFVRNGGTLVVAEDFGPHGNALLSGVGATARADGRAMYDNREFFRTNAFPVATPAGTYTETSNVETVVLNHGTAVSAGNATTLVTTSDYAYLDDNGNAALDGPEELRSYPVATRESIGSGQVVVVSDPSLFVNAMLDHGDNRQFARNVVAGHDTLVLDHSHTNSVPPLVAAMLAVRRSAELLVLCATALVGALLIADRRLDERLRSRIANSRTAADDVQLSENGVQEYLRDRHPEWDEETITRVTKAVMAHRSEGRDND